MAKKIKSNHADADGNNAADGRFLIREIKIARRKGDTGISWEKFEELLRKNPGVLGGDDPFD